MGDEVWVLQGANSVYILRPEYHGQHSFIGEASLWEKDPICQKV
jgi:hypothetical protein